MLSFENADWFWLLLLVALIGTIVFLMLTRFERGVTQVFTAKAKAVLGIQTYSQVRRLKLSFLLLGSLFLVLALAGPRIPGGEVEVEQEGSDIIIALDISQSMMVRDVPPDRLRQSVRFLTDFITAIEGERVGLIFFAGSAYRQMPLSTDIRLAHIFLRNADPSQISNQGTSIGDAIELAIDMFEPEKERGKLLIIVSDGEDHDPNTLKAAEKAKNLGVYVLAAGVGTLEGGPVPEMHLGKERFIRDMEGNVVLSKFNPLALRRVADTAGGRYFNLNDDEKAGKEMKDIIAKIKKGVVAVQNITAYKPLYQYPLAIGILFYILYMLWPIRQREI